MKGRRIYPNADGRLYFAEGDYGLDPRDGHWYGRPPGAHTGSMKRHEVVEHEDGTITVSPSILIHDGERVWHGYLRNGIWTEC